MSDEMIKAIYRWRYSQMEDLNGRLEIGSEEYRAEKALIDEKVRRAEEQRLEAIGMGDESHLADYISVLEERVTYLENMVKQLVGRVYGASYQIDNWKPPESRPFWLFLD
jgi:hypothetical protein